MEVTPFSQQLAHMGKGVVDAELTEVLTGLVKAVKETGKKGSLTLKISMKRETGTEDMVRLSVDAIKTSLPQNDRPPSIYWATYAGDLLRQDPEQRALELKEAPRGGGELKDVK